MSRRYTKEQKKEYLEILQKHNGMVLYASMEYGINRDTHYAWMNSDPWFKKEVEDIEKSSVEFVENQLYKLIKEGNEKAIIFYLKTKGKKYGYSTNLNLEIKSDVIEFKFQNAELGGNTPQTPLLPLDIDEDDIDNDSLDDE